MSRDSARGICFVGANIFDPVRNSIGGAERQMRLLGGFLASRGWQVRYTALRHLTLDLDRTAVPGEITSFRASTRFKGLAWILASTPVLVGVPEGVLYQRGGGALTAATYVASRISHKRFVWAVASDADCSFSASYQRAAKAIGSNPVRRAWQYLLTRLIDHAIRNADLVLYQHEGQLAGLVSERRIPKERLQLLRNAVEIPERVPDGAPRDTIAWIGSLRPNKRPELFIRLAEEAHVPMTFAMAGRIVPGDLATYFPRGTDTAVVQLVGELTHPQVIELLSHARLLVTTSIVEGFPNTWLEAWSLGVPVISLGLDPGGVLSEHGCGWLTHSFEELLETVQRVSADDEVWRTCSEACHAYARSDHAVAASGARLEALLGELVRETS